MMSLTSRWCGGAAAGVQISAASPAGARREVERRADPRHPGGAASLPEVQEQGAARRHLDRELVARGELALEQRQAIAGVEASDGPWREVPAQGGPRALVLLVGEEDQAVARETARPQRRPLFPYAPGFRPR